MNIMGSSLVSLQVVREVAERGSFTAAATALGYTQSAISRRVTALEHAAGTRLFDRHFDGVVLTRAGQTLLRHVVVALDAVAAAGRELEDLPSERGVVRLGTFPSAGVLVLPRALATMRRSHPAIRITTREATTAALLRALYAGTLDLAVLASRPPHSSFGQDQELQCETLLDTQLMLAVPVASTLGRQERVTLQDLVDQEWIVSSSSATEQTLGVWPGLPGRPMIAHIARDWLTKLQLVGAGCGITTVPPGMTEMLPPTVRLVSVQDCDAARRQVVLARLPGPCPPAVEQVARILRRELELIGLPRS
ncbi:LysR family transcriptional regulator [Streptomyces umbrinus]|uniref:LysR family transcriptional regulator n=1 Tax=Streptomyces umbrinus TaxID=67370 RepID=UPI003C2F5A19